jgi:predicted aldo/keto reductase-like oxidoreductase
MIYRQLGKTGYRVSQLGFGAMRLPMEGKDENHRIAREKAIPMIHRAFEEGVNYIDTAVGYCNEDSQRAVGEALKGWREKIVVSTKNHYFDEDEKTWWEHLENSLDRLQVEYIDIYNHHGVNRDSFAKIQSHVGKWMQKARDQGLIKHVCCSYHDNNEFLRELVESGYPAVITLQYNLLDRALEEGIALAHEKGIGIVVMGPVAGGRLGATNKVMQEMVPGIERVPELALRFVLANPNVSMALSGMSTMEQVEENLAITSQEVSLSAEDTERVSEQLTRLKVMSDLYCTGCKYCMPCPSGVNIAGAFEAYNAARIYDLREFGKQRYAAMQKNNAGADLCTECGVCEEKCPQGIPVQRQLKEVHAALAADA